MSISEAWASLELDMNLIEAVIYFWNNLHWLTLALHKPAIDRKGDGREGRRDLGIITQWSEAQHSESMLT